MRAGVVLGATAIIAVGVGAAMVAPRLSTAQAPSAPKARYWIDASTTSGLGMGGNPMSALMGGGGGAQHNLWFRIGSTLAPTGGTPKADHFVPAGLKLGQSVALDTPVSKSGGDTPYEYKRPKGRLRIFWGCGAHVGPGQPVVIDFAKVAAGQFPPNLFTVNVPVERGPDPGNSRTYATWPNPLEANKAKTLKPGASLLGPHRIAGNYSPEISFTLAQDFMPPLKARSPDGPGGTVNLSWDPVAAATGYYAMAIGGMGEGSEDSVDMVWWASSASKEFGGGLQSYIAPATVTRLIGQKIVMPPSQTSCMIPAEVKAAAGQMLITTLTAYGPEANFVYPPKPDDPKIPWKVEWTAKVRYKSETMAIAGLDMGAMMSGADASEDSAPPDKKKCKKKGGFGGLLGRAVGTAMGGPSDC